MIQAAPADPVYSISSRLTSGYWAMVNIFGTEEHWKENNSIIQSVSSRFRLWVGKPGAAILMVIAAVESAVHWFFADPQKLGSSVFAIRWNWEAITNLTWNQYLIPTKEVFARCWVGKSCIRREDLFAVDRLFLENGKDHPEVARREMQSLLEFNVRYRWARSVQGRISDFTRGVADLVSCGKSISPEAFAQATNLHSDVIQYALMQIVWNTILNGDRGRDDEDYLGCMHPDSYTDMEDLQKIFFVNENWHQRLNPNWATRLKEDNCSAAMSVAEFREIQEMLSADLSSLGCFRSIESFSAAKEHPLIKHLLKPIVDREIRENTMWIADCLPRAQEQLKSQNNA